MKKAIYNFPLICGLLLMLAAFPVFAQSNETELNKKPLQEFGRLVSIKVQKREIDLKTPFSLTMQGKLDETGSIDEKTVKFTKSEGDMEMVGIAKQGIEALSNSKLFYSLKSLGVREIEISLVQTEAEFSVNFKSTLENDNRAKSISSAINLFLQTSKTASKNQDTNALLESSKVESVGKDFLIKFSMPLEQFHGMINKEVEKVKQ